MDVCVEPFLDELIAQGAGEGRLRFTESVAEGVRPSTVVFICVGTPPLENGEADLSAIEDVVRRIAEVTDGRMVIVEKSTVPVVATDWEEFKRLDLPQVKRRMRQAVIIDGRNIFDPGLMEALGFDYVGMGR